MTAAPAGPENDLRRYRYSPSGRVSWRIVPVLALAVLSMWALADLNFRADKFGLRAPLVVASVFAIFGGGAAAFVVIYGRCRNVLLAGALGGLLGAGWMLGYYQISLIDAKVRGAPAGWRGLSWADLTTGLPEYLLLRMRNSTDVWRRPDENRDGPATANALAVAARGVTMALEIALAVAFGVYGGLLTAKQPYSEPAQRWTSSTSYCFQSVDRAFWSPTSEAVGLPPSAPRTALDLTMVQWRTAPGDPTAYGRSAEKRNGRYVYLSPYYRYEGERRARMERLFAAATSPT